MVGKTDPRDPLTEAARNRAMQSGSRLIEQYKNTFRHLEDAGLGRLRFTYAENVVYRDRVREIRGIVALEDHFASMFAEIPEIRFEFTDQLIGERTAYLKWLLHYSSPSAPARVSSLHGVSHLQFGDRIEFQENFYQIDQHIENQPAWLDTLSRWLGKKPARNISAMGL
jgi:hypothetical protein